MSEMFKQNLDGVSVDMGDAQDIPKPETFKTRARPKAFQIDILDLNPDVDGDGKVTPWEKDCFERIKAADANGSGTLNVHELYSVIKGKGIPIESLNPDADGDGKVELWETQCFERIKKADVDQSGTISPHELYGIMKGALQTEKSKKVYRNLFFLAVLVILGLLGAMAAISFVMGEAVKESHVSSSGIMTGASVTHAGASPSRRRVLRMLEEKASSKELDDEIPKDAKIPVSTDAPVYEMEVYDLAKDKIVTEKDPKGEEGRLLEEAKETKEYEFDYMAMLEKVKDVSVFVDGKSRRRLQALPENACVHRGRSLSDHIPAKEDIEMTFKVTGAMKPAPKEVMFTTSTGAVVKIDEEAHTIKVEIDGEEFEADDKPKIDNRRRKLMGMRLLNEEVTKKTAKSTQGTAGVTKFVPAEPLLEKMTEPDEEKGEEKGRKA